MKILISIPKKRKIFSTFSTALLIIDSEEVINKIPPIINPILNIVNTIAAHDIRLSIIIYK